MATKKDKEKQMEAVNAAALKAEELSKAGGIPMDGLSLTGAPESTIGMSKNERFFSQGRALDQQQREGYKTFGDKATGEGINKLRALQGRPAISNTPKEFSDNINKSVGFGGESALLDQAGRDRALKGGIGAGLSYEEADAAVSKAYDFLKKKYGDKTTPTTPTTLDGSGNDPRIDVTSPKVAPPLTLPPVVQVEKGPIGQFFDNVLSGGSPERALVKGGSMYIAEKARRAKAAAKAAAEAAAKAGGAVGDAAKTAGVVDDAAKAAGAAGDAAKPFNMVDDAAKAAAEALKQKYDIPKIADDVPVKTFNMVDEAAKAAKAANAKAIELMMQKATQLRVSRQAAEKAGLDAYNAALQAGQGKEAAVVAGDAAESAALKAAYKDAADSVGKPFDAVDEAAGAADEAAGAADEAAGAADEAAGATDKAAGAADEAAKAAGKGGGLFSKLSEGVAKSQLGRGALATGRVAGKGLRVFGRVAGPALEIYDAGRYLTGDQEVKDQYLEDTATLGQRVFQPKSFGEFAGGVGDVLSPTKNVLGTYEGVSQLLKSQREARGAEASAKHAENVIKAQHDRRKELYPDEEFDKLPKKTKQKIMQSIRKEFIDAGVQTYARFQ